MNKTKIDWCDMSWNPVTGCYHDCKYCYAHNIANRFNGGLDTDKKLIELKYPVKDREDRLQPYPYGFKPTLHEYRLGEPEKKTKGKTIFVCSMSDLFGTWVPDEWIVKIFDVVEKCQQHKFIFLTKNGERYRKIFENNRMKRLKKARAKFKSECIFIKDWFELDKINKESDTHILEVNTELGSGWIYSKNKNDNDYYLSTHTFYGLNYQYESEKLQECGFNVILDNWDEQEKKE